LFFSEKVHQHGEAAKCFLQKYCIGKVLKEDISSFSTHSIATIDDSSSLKQTSNKNNSLHSNFTGTKWQDLVDMNRAMFFQVISIFPPELYQKWIHAVYSPTRTLRIFEWNWLEIFTHWPWWYIFPMWIPILLAMLYHCYFYHQSSIIKISFYFSIGLLLWFIMEYNLHRFLFHCETSSSIGNVYHFLAHGLHHLIPSDPTRLTFPPWFSLLLTISIYLPFWLLRIPVSSPFEAISSGVITGYLFYDTLHFFIHLADNGNEETDSGMLSSYFFRIKYFRLMKARHIYHHFKNPNVNYGVTNPCFDIFLGTNI